MLIKAKNPPVIGNNKLALKLKGKAFIKKCTAEPQRRLFLNFLMWHQCFPYGTFNDAKNHRRSDLGSSSAGARIT